MTSPIDVMVLAPHPDDAEVSCAGTILRLTDAGHRVAIVDMTRGEKATKGTPEIRHAESEAAAWALGLCERTNLALPDAAMRDDEPALAAVVGAIRRLRPRLLLAPYDRDLHPDHEAAGKVARRAFFVAGLKNALAELGAPFRPHRLIHYPLHHEFEPTLCVDISDVQDRKLAVLRCYTSQLEGDTAHLASLDIVSRAHARDLHYGARTGCRAAEPFLVDGPWAVDDPTKLL